MQDMRETSGRLIEEYPMKMTHIEIPTQFQRNSPNVLALGVENTGSTIINYGNELLGSDLSDKDVLDIGCGVRFTQTIINRDIPIGSYTGVDIDRALIDYLATNIQDSRFSFYFWHIHNEQYNPAGKKLTKRTRLPLPQAKQFDVIWMYSVITHNYPSDTECLLHILRKRYIRKDGGLLFSALIDNSLDKNQLKNQPPSGVYYNEKHLRQIISKTGWQLESISNKRSDAVMQTLFLCRPKSHFWQLW